MAKRKRKGSNQFHKRIARKLSSESLSSFVLYEYEVTDEPLEDSTVPDEIRNEMENLYKKSKEAPHLIIERLIELINKYPNVPKLYNFIGVAYSRLKDREQSKLYVIKNYENNPDYLFAKLNYAEICMFEGDYEKIPEIFDHKFDLKALYPERNVFHISEVVGFMGISGLYFAHVGKVEQAKLFCTDLEQFAPNHPFTEQLKQHLLFNAVKEEFNRLLIGGK
jgi:tetratricopeptide (TPR) repeat protein